MDARYCGGMDMYKYQDQLYRGYSNSSPGDMMWKRECYYHGSSDMLSEDPRERSGLSYSNSNSNSNSSGEFWRGDREMLPEDLNLDEVSPIKTRPVPFLEMREKGLTGSMESSISKNMYQAYHGKLFVCCFFYSKGGVTPIKICVNCH